MSVPPLVITVVARFDYMAHNADELTFSKGERFIVLEKVASSKGWFVVERMSNHEQGLAPGNYFRDATKRPSPRPSPRPEAEKKKASPRNEVAKSPRDEDDNDDGAPPPPLPGPPPKWSETIAGAAALRLLGKEDSRKKSPRSAADVFAGK